MSGGDGRDHNSGAHNSGGAINGGPTGIGVGGGGNSKDGVPDSNIHIGSGTGNFKIDSLRYEGGWVNGYNSKGNLVASSRPIGDGLGGEGGNSGHSGNITAAPNEIFSFTETTSSGESVSFTGVGVRLVNSDTGNVTNHIYVENKGDAKTKDKNIKDKPVDFPLRGTKHSKVRYDNDYTYSDLFKYSGNKATLNLWDGSFTYHIDYDENGNVKNISEDKHLKKFGGYPKDKNSRINQAKNVAERGYKRQSENIREHNITIKEYSYNVILNSLGIVESITKKFNEYNKFSITKKQREMVNEWYKSQGFDTDDKRENFAKKLAGDIWKSYPKNKQAVDAAEKEALMGAADIITSAGEKISEHLGDKYKSIANEIAGDLRNFQGKKLRSLSDALKTLEKITGNPNMKISQADRNVLANAVRHIDTKTLADNFQRLGKAFGVFGNVLTAEKLREKTAVGFETGNWQPLMLEVEAMVISGYAAGIAVSLATSVISSIASVLAIGTLPTTLTIIAAITLISYLASLIDDKVVDKINNLLIPKAH
ncbi:colicin [Morganella morganii subsp. morganii]|uniref:colicin-like pore-forming protein n=1 Tax=Morganella morganii TaxID=582 RepID=UPI001BD98E17|nr:colicin-like pore-forming protein [Morganella morganii]MBT0366448.1 colicin [Morganella morganii subsp. morganii]